MSSCSTAVSPRLELVFRVWMSVLQIGENFFLHPSINVGDFEMTNIYVGNLPYSTNSDDLKAAFSEYGEVAKATVITDRETGRSKGFGFVEMSDDSAASDAIEALNGHEVGGRPWKVNVARPREERPPRRW